VGGRRGNSAPYKKGGKKEKEGLRAKKKGMKKKKGTRGETGCQRRKGEGRIECKKRGAAKGDGRELSSVHKNWKVGE